MTRSIKSITVALGGEFEGMSVTVRINPKLRILADIDSGNYDRMIAALSELLLSWSNVEDEEGKPIPDIALVRAGKVPDTNVLKLIGELDVELMMAMAKAAKTNIGALSGN